MNFKWNIKEFLTTTVWNPSINCESLESYESSLKERLRAPISGKRPGDQLADIGQGLALIMDYIESKETPTLTQKAIESLDKLLALPQEELQRKFEEEHQKHTWVFTGESCPECGGKMIENHRYIECGARHCCYIKEEKQNRDNR